MRNKKIKIVSIMLIFIATILYQGYRIYDNKHTNEPTGLIEATVTRVVDGDTIKINYQGNEETVRMIGIDTPESVHPDNSKNTEAGRKASNYTKERLDGKTIKLEFDVAERDKYGRLLAYVWINDKMYNMELLENNMAELMTVPPNVKYESEFQKAKKEAKY